MAVKAPKRLLEAPPPAESSEEEESGSEEAVNEEEEEHDAQNGDAQGPDDGEKSGDEEEEEGDDDGEEGDDEDEQEEEEKKKPTGKKAQEESGSGSDSDTDTDTDNNDAPSPSTSDFTIKPSKPMDDSAKPKPKKPTTTIVLATPVSKSKRAAEKELNGKDSKKKKVSDDEDSKKASGFQRLWSEDDEIAILKGYLDYKSKKGLDPSADMAAFYEFIKKNLHADADKSQLMNKVRRLKKKYQINAAKGENDEDPVFAKPHDRKSFELSKKIWGDTITTASATATAEANHDGSDDNNKGSRRKLYNNGSKTSKSTSNGEVKADPDEFWSKHPFLKASLRIVNSDFALEVLPLVESSKVKELENKWKKIYKEELEVKAKRDQLAYEQNKLVIDSV